MGNITSFKKGHKPANKGVYRDGTPSYATIHKLVAERYGRPDKCGQCGDTRPGYRKYHWANLTGNYTSVEKRHWARLCRSCHWRYDRKSWHNNKPNKNNKSGHKNISWDDTRTKWVVMIKRNGKQRNLGRYKDIETAIKARDEFKERIEDEKN